MDPELRVIIVDDEPLARRKIAGHLARAGRAAVVSECATVAEAVDAITAVPSDVVFLDVDLGGASGFDVVDQVGISAMPPTVFVTAHESFAIKAFETEAVDYLLKPYSEDRFQRVLERLRERREQGSSIGGAELRELLERLGGSRAETDRLVVRTKGQYEVVKVADILWIEAANNYLVLHTPTRKHMLRDTMQNLMKRLDPDRFLRVQRSTIVNLDRVQAIRPYSGVEYEIVLDNGKKLLSGRSYRDTIRQFILRR